MKNSNYYYAKITFVRSSQLLTEFYFSFIFFSKNLIHFSPQLNSLTISDQTKAHKQTAIVKNKKYNIIKCEQYNDDQPEKNSTTSVYITIQRFKTLPAFDPVCTCSYVSRSLFSFHTHIIEKCNSTCIIDATTLFFQSVQKCSHSPPATCGELEMGWTMLSYTIPTNTLKSSLFITNNVLMQLAVASICIFVILPLTLVGTVLGRNLSGTPNYPCRINAVPRYFLTLESKEESNHQCSIETRVS